MLQQLIQILHDYCNKNMVDLPNQTQTPVMYNQ